MKLASPITSGWTLSAVDPAPESPAFALPTGIEAQVPGTVHTDLLAAGLVEDPYIDLNETKLDWIGHTVWEYRTQLDWVGVTADRAELVFDGLDTVAVVSLNGTEIGRTANQHRSYRFDVTAQLREGANALAVRFESAWDYARGIEEQLGGLPNVYPSPFNFIRKMASNFGWDWGPQLVTAGIWREARLETWSTARLDEVRYDSTLDGSAGVTTVTIAAQLDAPTDLFATVALAGQSVTVPLVDGAATLRLEVPDVDVWWPVGMGDQPLYDLVLTLHHGDTVLDGARRRIGYRQVQIDSAADESGSAFTFVVNGEPLFIRGANWITDDAFPSRVTPERYRERIEQAIGANLHLLRVWGGGIYESDTFYEICDELGVMVWQDFLFSCAAYPEEEPIRAEVIAEAHENIVRLSSHASLVLWNGSNENIMGWFIWPWQQPIGDRTWGLGYYLDILPALVAELAPSVPYWASSPYSGTMDIHANEPAHGNMHIWDVWNEVDYSVYGDYEPRFVSEFGFQGPPTWSTITRSISDDPLSPTSAGMLHHQKAINGNEKLTAGLVAHLPLPQTMEDWHFAMQLNQARAIAFGIERFRSQRPHCMGTIVWQLNDCWPVTSWAAIDGYGRRKPLWHALARVNRDVLVTVQPGADGLMLHIVNDGGIDIEGTVTIERLDVDDELLASQTVQVAAGRLSRTQVRLEAAVSVPGDRSREYIEVRMGSSVVAIRPFVEDKQLALRPVRIEVAAGPWLDGVQQLVLTASAFARGVTVYPDRIDPAAWVDQSDLSLRPHRPVTITLHSPQPIESGAFAEPFIVRSTNELVAAEAELSSSSSPRR